MKTRTIISRSDLVKLELDHLEPTFKQRRLASFLGFDWIEPPKEEKIGSVSGSDGGFTLSKKLTQPKDIRPDPVVFFRPETFRELTPERSTEGKTETTGVSPQWLNKPRTRPVHKILPMPQDVVAKLAAILSYRQESRTLDLPRFTKQLARLEIHRKIPRRMTNLAPNSIQVIVDRSVRLTPIWDDQTCFVKRLFDAFPGVEIRPYVYVEAEGILIDPLDQGREVIPSPSVGPFLALSDLGMYGGDSEYWKLLGGSIVDGGGIAAALLPSKGTIVSQELLTHWRCAAWDEAAALNGTTSAALQQLLVLLAPALRIEPGLLRDIRQKLLPDSSVDAELLFWKSHALTSAHSDAATMSTDARTFYRKEFLSLARSKIGQSRAREALSIIRRWRADCPDEIWFEEIVDLPDDLHRLFNESDVAHALAYYKTLRHEQEADNSTELDFNRHAWLRRNGPRLHEDGGWSQPDVREVVKRAFKDTPDQAPLIGPGKGPLITNPVGSISLVQEGAYIHLSSRARVWGSNLALLPSDDGEIECFEFRPPSWADRTGSDIYGDWAEIEFGGVVQRLRRIPAGNFLIGSPEEEEGRWDDESPQTEVSFNADYWLFDTAVTIAFWNAVMDSKTAKDKNNDLPKVDVSWHDIQEFLLRINKLKPELLLRLPSEAEWEYACRARTETPYFFGRSTNKKEIHFGEKLGRIPVHAKQPNAWGLYQMHGNVREWCDDLWDTSHSGINVYGKPRLVSKQKVESRVVRGGSWVVNAHLVRAACRDALPPGVRLDDLGFRCVPNQVGTVVGDDRLPVEWREVEPPHGESAVVKRTELVRISRTKSENISIPASSFMIRSDRAELEFVRITKSDISWATALGRDEYGLWARLDIQGIEIPFRWIPPGQFKIGSLPEEVEYAESASQFTLNQGSEEPQTLVTFERGYWIMDAPVTQALWETVMSDNPSRFQSPDRPVEQLSWHDITEFIVKLNEELFGASLRLPSESEWEYACRAGSDEATYAGAMNILGANDAPVLDEIAWYGGNSGFEFELEEGYASGGWKEKQYEHITAGTRPVRRKSPNCWGCYDLLGNVYEWCEDVWSKGHHGIDLHGQARRGESSLNEDEVRVLRGGSWISGAYGVRAASRVRGLPDVRDYSVGFRCVLGSASSVDRPLKQRNTVPRSDAKARIKSITLGGAFKASS